LGTSGTLGTWGTSLGTLGTWGTSLGTLGTWGTSLGTLGTSGTSGRWCDIFSGNHMYYQPTLYTCQRIYSVRSGKNLVVTLYMSYVCITDLPENILLRLLPIGLMEKKKPLAFLQRVSLFNN
jgi:hypothetical protein